MMTDILGMRAIVTGGSRGVGREFSIYDPDFRKAAGL
jgi:hypothetical protein